MHDFGGRVPEVKSRIAEGSGPHGCQASKEIY